MDDSRMIKTKFWADEYIQDLTPLQRYLYLYILTNERTNIAGCYEINIKRICFDTGLPAPDILAHLERFKSDDKALFSDGWLSIKNFTKHQNFTSVSIQQGIDKIMSFAPQSHKDFTQYQDPHHTPTTPPPHPHHTPHTPRGEGMEEREYRKGSGSGSGSGKGKGKEITTSGQSAHFIKPTLEQVQDYIKHLGTHINPHAFIDHYESNGWKVGKNPMKSWQAAVRTWKHNGLDNPTQSHTLPKEPQTSPFSPEALADVERLVKGIGKDLNNPEAGPEQTPPATIREDIDQLWPVNDRHASMRYAHDNGLDLSQDQINELAELSPSQRAVRIEELLNG